MKTTKPGTFTYQEINSQPAAWREALKLIDKQSNEIGSFIKTRSYKHVLFTGCGSTYYLSLAAASFLQSISGLHSLGIPGSELWLNPGSTAMRKPDGDERTLLVAVSRSGATTETIHASEAFLKRKMGDLVTISCYADQPLASMGGLNLVYESGQEQSVAQTRAFSTIYLAACFLGLIIAGKEGRQDSLKRLPGDCEQLLKDSIDLAARVGNDQHNNRFYFLGSGTRYGLACELSLKMKEMSLSHSEPFHFLEFRHGPMSMVNDQTIIVALLSEENRTYEATVLLEMRKLGARCITIGKGDCDVPIKTTLPEPFYNALYLPFGQLLAYQRSLASGLDPDLPKNLTSVVHLT